MGSLEEREEGELKEMTFISEEKDEKLFKELRELISELHGIAGKYPTLYEIYLRVATPERMKRGDDHDLAGLD